MRQGDSDRHITRSRLMGRKKLVRLRAGIRKNWPNACAAFRNPKTLECFDFDRLPGLNRARVQPRVSEPAVASRALPTGRCVP